MHIQCISHILQESWSRAIQARLKNMRRKPRSEAAGLVFEPLPKKKRTSNHASGSNQKLVEPLDSTSIQCHMTVLKKEWARTKRNRVVIKSLMSELGPAVVDVLKLYPPLTEYNYVSYTKLRL